MSILRSRAGKLGDVGLLLALAVMGGTVVALARANSVSLRADWGIAVGLAVAFFVARLLTTRLPQGDEVCVTVVVGLYGLAVADVRVVMAAAITAGLLDVVARDAQSPRGSSWARGIGAVRGTLVLGLLAPWQLVLGPQLSSGSVSDAAVAWVLLAGAAYSAVDIITVAAQERVAGGPPILRGIQGLLRPLGTVYIVHVAMAAVAVRLSGIPGVWAFPIALLLTLILQNSFNLYLRIRRGYAETISALAHAAELDRPFDSGHARRVADLAVVIGRRLGMTSHQLERIGYAALLHDIGRIGHHEGGDGPQHSTRGAEIVGSIPFLADISPIISPSGDATSEWQMVGAGIVRVCSQYDRLRADIGVTEAIEAMRHDSLVRDHSEVLDVLVEVVEGRYRGVPAA